MKTVISIIAILICLTVPVVAEELEFVKVKGIETAMFKAGKSSENVLLAYIVDRTTSQCFAMIGGGHGPAGITKIDCEPLKKIEAIKTYIDTGKLP